jgi:hypothetical protein
MASSAKLEHAFEMLDATTASNTTGTYQPVRSSVQLNAADFDGTPAFYFEIVAYNGNSSNDYNVSLIDVTNSATKATCAVPKNTSASTRIRSTSFSPSAGDILYRVQLPQTASSMNVMVYTARIVVVQGADATKTVIDIPLTGNATNSAPADAGAFLIGKGTTYTQYYSERHSRWLKVASAWDTVSGCALDAVVLSANGAYTATVGIVDVDNSDAEVASVSTTSTSLTHLYTTFAWASLADGHNFELKLKSSDANTWAYCGRSSLRIFMSSLGKGELYERISLETEGSGSSTEDRQRQLITVGNTSNPVCYFEVTGKCATNAAAVYAYQVNSDSANNGAAITGASVNFNSTTKARVRTAQITAPTSGYNVYTSCPTVADMRYIVNPFVVIAFSGSGGGAASLNTQVNIGDAWKTATAAQINIGDAWKPVTGIQVNIGDAWKRVL